MNQPKSEWLFVYNEWIPSQQGLREALCTLGNGYIATRGATEEHSKNDSRYAGTYLGGGYNRLETIIHGKIIENEDLVNWPDWTLIDLRINSGLWFSLDQVEIIEFSQTLNLFYGTLERIILFRFDDQETYLESRRLVSMANKNLAAIQIKIKPINWEGQIEIRSSINGAVTNSGVKRYRSFACKHLHVTKLEQVAEDAIGLSVKTLQSGIEMAVVAKTKVYEHDLPIPLQRETLVEGEKIAHLLKLKVRRYRTTTIEKTVAIFTSKDFAISNPFDAARRLANQSVSFYSILKEHKVTWKYIWDRFNISLEEMPIENKILRLHIFHLLQTISLHTIGTDVSVPSRGLHGEAYRGHIFWDEIFIFPFIYFRMPELANSLLMYRYRRLDEAKRLARESGFEGAMFPWQSGSDGREEGQKIHLNPISGNWVPDYTSRQRHLNGAIVYNIIKYFEVTDDRQFMSLYGAEMILEIAKFWVSSTLFNADKCRYEICHVVGPDEFHTHHSKSGEIGINNNAYTNYLASWSIRKALEVLVPLASSRREELMALINLTPGDLVHWEHVSRNIYIPLQKDGLILQFEGFDELRDFNWPEYKKKYGDLQRLDRILEAEGDSVNHYKVNKQADVLMLFYLFSAEEVKDGFAWLGYEFNSEWIVKNISYYLSLSSNGSSLSRIVHSWVLARSDRKNSWNIFKEALESDVSDIQGGTTSEGIHLGAMAGTVDIVQRCFTGMEVLNGLICFNPQLPDDLKRIDLTLRFQNHWMRLDLNHQHLKIIIDRSWEPEGKLCFRGTTYSFKEGTVFNFNLKDNSLQQGVC